MAKKNNVPVPAPVRVISPEERLERLNFYLTDAFSDASMVEAQKSFADSVAKSGGSYSYAIKWKAYDVLVFEALEKHLCELRTYRAKILTGPDMLEQFKGSLLSFREQLCGDLLKSWRVEWDSSTCAFANQIQKAEARAIQLAVERIDKALRAIEFYQEVTK